MNEINYVTGDLFTLMPKDVPVIIPHICNDIGAFGGGFTGPLGRKFPIVADLYLEWAKSGYDPERAIPFTIGETQVIAVQDDPRIYVANMVAQHGIIGPNNPTPIKYTALAFCMRAVREIEIWDRNNEFQIHAPKFGSGLAAGAFSVIEKFVNELWIANGFDVTIYSL